MFRSRHQPQVFVHYHECWLTHTRAAASDIQFGFGNINSLEGTSADCATHSSLYSTDCTSHSSLHTTDSTSHSSQIKIHRLHISTPARLRSSLPGTTDCLSLLQPCKVLQGPPRVKDCTSTHQEDCKRLCCWLLTFLIRHWLLSEYNFNYLPCVYPYFYFFFFFNYCGLSFNYFLFLFLSPWHDDDWLRGGRWSLGRTNLKRRKDVLICSAPWAVTASSSPQPSSIYLFIFWWGLGTWN